MSDLERALRRKLNMSVDGATHLAHAVAAMRKARPCELHVGETEGLRPECPDCWARMEAALIASLKGATNG